MFNDIEELMQTIDKFKTNVIGSEELLSVLKSTSQKLEQYEASRNDDKKQLLESVADAAKKITKKINLVLMVVTILALLIIILKFIK